MAKIQKLDLNRQIINPFRTSRNSSSNPFKYQDFEGNTLDVSAFADVFEGSKQNTSRLRLITSSVMGSMTKLHHSITEPIVNFVKRIGTGISSVWEYATNTKVTEFGSYKPIADIMNTDIVDIGKGIGHTISDGMAILDTDIVDIGKGLKNSLADRLSFLNTDITDIGKDLVTSWSELIGSIKLNKSLKDKSVEELRALWIANTEPELTQTTKSLKEVA